MEGQGKKKKKAGSPAPRRQRASELSDTAKSMMSKEAGGEMIRGQTRGLAEP